MDDPGNVFKFVRFHELEAAKTLNGVGHAYSMNDSTGLLDPGDDRDLDDEYVISDRQERQQLAHPCRDTYQACNLAQPHIGT